MAKDFHFKDYGFAPKSATGFAFLLYGKEKVVLADVGHHGICNRKEYKDREVNRMIAAGTSKHWKINSDQQEREPILAGHPAKVEHICFRTK